MSKSATPIGLESALRDLQRSLAQVDLLNEPSDGNRLELLLLRHKDIAVRMDGSLNHPRAHVHLDYDGRHHVASYAIDDGSHLAGDRTYDRPIGSWIGENRPALMQVWRSMRAGTVQQGVVAALQGTVLPKR
jgi:hypothetical protein